MFTECREYYCSLDIETKYCKYFAECVVHISLDIERVLLLFT